MVFGSCPGNEQSEPEEVRDVASYVNHVCQGSFPAYIVGRPRRHGFFVALRRTGSPFLRLEVFPAAGGIPGSRSAAIVHNFKMYLMMREN